MKRGESAGAPAPQDPPRRPAASAAFVRSRALIDAYDRIHDAFVREGVDVDRFYNDAAYFHKDASGQLVASAGSHPTLAHWPLQRYPGGDALRAALQRQQALLQGFLGVAEASWIAVGQWHSTVFSSVHSADPAAIAASASDFRDIAEREVRQTPSYDLVFTRITVTRDGGILALGYPSGLDLAALRSRLCRALSQGHAPGLVHVTLGHLRRLPSPDSLSRLKRYVGQFVRDETRLGTIAVHALAYALYSGPFLEMHLSRLADIPLAGSAGRQEDRER